jgi:hypothetical protein
MIDLQRAPVQRALLRRVPSRPRQVHRFRVAFDNRKGHLDEAR